MSVVNNDTQVLKNYVGGKWVDTAGEKFGEVINPSTGEVIAKVPLSTKEDVANAVETAQKHLKHGVTCLLQNEQD